MRQIILDTETTGLEPELGHRVIEIGCVEVLNRRRTGRVFHRYLCPDREIDPGALQVHGLTAEFLRGQRAKMVLLQRVLEGVFAECDVVVQTSPIPFDMIGLPLVAFPIGFEESRGFPLPLSGMLGGLPFGEERLLSLVAAYQAETEWHRRRPADPSGEGEVQRGGGGGASPRLRLDVLDVLESCE
jgi:hypothetical protein